MLRAIFCLLLLLGGCGLPAAARPPARPRVRLLLRVNPATHAFSCRYTLVLPATDSATTLRLNLNRAFRVQLPRHAAAQVRRVYYPYLSDTLQQLVLPGTSRPVRRFTFTYSGVLAANRATAEVLEFSGHSQWLPFRPCGEYEPVAYTLTVQVPPGWQVRGTAPARRQRAGATTLAGTAGAIEPTALVARHFAEASQLPLTVCKAGTTLLPADSALLTQAHGIIGFYNRTLGRQDSIVRFRVLLPGTDQDAFALLDNAAVITYRNFEMSERGDLLILAHEISHRWWTYGSVHTYDDWLNEAFATYSSLLYLQARGDTAGYRLEYAKRAATTAGTPPLLGFDRTRYEPGMYRRVVYNKGTVVLAALHRRVGTELFFLILAVTAGHHVSTTTQFLDVVGELAGADTRAWLLAALSQPTPGH